MPSLQVVLGEAEAAQSGEQRRSLMKAFVETRGGKIKKREEVAGAAKSA